MLRHIVCCNFKNCRHFYLLFTYCHAHGVKTQADVRLELIEMEKAELASGKPPDNISATSLLTAALDIEDAQCAPLQASIDNMHHTYSIRRCALQVKVAQLDNSPTATQRAHIEESRLVLHKRILNFRATQALLVPETVMPTDTEEDKPECATLRLPSELVGSCPFSPRVQSLANMEASLRFAQATDAVSGLRQSLTIRAELSRYKGMQVRGQHANTRMRALLAGAEEKTMMFASRYRRARLAYARLMGPGDWECILKPLNDADIRPVSSHQDDEGLTARTGPREGHRRVSWIYMMPGGSEDSIQLSDGVLCAYRSTISTV